MNRHGRGYGYSLRSSKAVGSSREEENESEHENEPENNATEEYKRNIKAAEEVKGDTKTETLSKSKEVGDKKAADKRAIDSKPAVKSEGFACAKEEHGNKKKKMSPDTLSDFEKIWTEEHKRKMKAAEEVKGPSKSKVVEDEKSADKSAIDNMSADILKVYAGAKKEQGGEKKKTSSETPPDVLKTDSAANKGSVRREKHSSKQGHFTDKAFFVSATPLQADIDEIKPFFDEQRRNLDPIVMQVLQVLDKEEDRLGEQSEKIKTCIFLGRREDTDEPNEYKILKVQKLICSEKEKVIETTALPQISKDTDEQKLVSEQTASKFAHAVPSENERKVAKSNTDVDASMPTVQCSEEIAKQQQNPDLKVQQKFSSEKKGTESAVLCRSSSDIVERKQNLLQNASGVQQVISSENNYVTELIPLKSSEDTNEHQQSLGLKVLKDSSSENKEAFKIKTEEFESRNLFQYSQNIDRQKQNLDMEVEQELSSKNVKVLESAHLLQSSKDAEKLKQDLDIKVSKELLDPSSENEKQVIELKPEESESTTSNQCSQDIDYRKLTSVLRAQGHFPLDNDTKSAESKIGVNETTCPLQDSKHTDINERIQDFDLNTSNVQQDNLLGTQSELSEFESEQREQTINLSRDVNLRFEFDSLGNKTVLVDDKDQFKVDKKQKITFNIGKGNVKLSFIDNKVSIFTQGSEIDCSMRQNQVRFSLKDSTTHSIPLSRIPSIRELIGSKYTAFVKDLDNIGNASMAKDFYFYPSEEINPESRSENVSKSTSKTDSCSARSSVRQNLENLTGKFLKSVVSSCDDFENSYLESLMQRKE